MALNEVEQLKKMIDGSTHLLLIFAATESVDAAVSAVAVKQFLTKRGQRADVACSNFTIPRTLKFLPGVENVERELTHLQKFIVKIDVSKTAIDSLTYDIKDNWLSIYITPKNGTITRRELRTAQSTYKYDAILIFGTRDLESLGDIYLNNTDLFYRTPIVVIDNHPANERYGQINFVDVTATSTSEIVYQLLKQLDEHIIEPTIATLLLTGMISATKSFKTPNVTPHVLAMASELINMGADRDKIIHHLYRSRPLPTLKLWGTALTHLKHDTAGGLVSTTLTRDDFMRAGATAEDIKGLIEDLISNSPEAKLIVVLYEDTGLDGKTSVKGIIENEKDYSAIDLVKRWQGQGDKKRATFVVEGKTVQDAEKEVMESIKTNLASKL